MVAGETSTWASELPILRGVVIVILFGTCVFWGRIFRYREGYCEVS